MANNQNDEKTIHVIVRPASPVLKVVVVLLILCSIAALYAQQRVHSDLQSQIQELRGEASAEAYRREVLEEKMVNPDSVEALKAIAKEELGLVDPDTIVIDPVS